jgi:hypothetical protein
MLDSSGLRRCSQAITVGTALAGRPPYRSQRALPTHWAPASGSDVEALASRTRSSSLGTPWFRLCVRDAFCLSVFPLAKPLPSATSAPGFPVLFGRFVGTTGLSDFPGPFICGLRPWPSRSVPPHDLRRATQGPPGSRAWRFRTCAGSSTARGQPGACNSAPVCVAFRLHGRRQHPGLYDFAAQCPSLCVPLSTLRRPPHGSLRMTRGHRGSLLLRCTALSSAPPCRFIPAHPYPHDAYDRRRGGRGDVET